MAVVMAIFLSSSPLVLVIACLVVVLASVGLTSIMASTAAVDFGGRKATATCSGLVDGCTYLGSGIQSFCIGFLVPNQAGDASLVFGLFPRDWHWWPLFMMPFGLLGLWVAIKIWNALPEATRKYVEQEKSAKAAAAGAGASTGGRPGAK
jgi:OPA family glycerol-3-phosphate transporter-like MFS transporter